MSAASPPLVPREAASIHWQVFLPRQVRGASLACEVGRHSTSFLDCTASPGGGASGSGSADPAGSRSAGARESADADSGFSAGATSSTSPAHSSEGSDNGEGGSEGPESTWRCVWSVAVEGQMEFEAPRPSSWYEWLSRKIALHHVRGTVSEEEGDFNTLEADVADGAAHCLHFLADSFGGGKSRVKKSSLQDPYMDDALGDRLQEMVAALIHTGSDWRWEVLNVDEAKLERLFMIVGASRSGSLAKGKNDILGAMGQQFVLKREQSERFLDRSGGVRTRVAVLQELLFEDSVLVADVSLRTKQTSAVTCPGGEVAASNDHPKVVGHVLRMEMSLERQRGVSDSSGFPVLRPSSWTIVDWNWLCMGNHPALPRGYAAPW